MTIHEKAARFRQLHDAGDIFIMANAWCAGSDKHGVATKKGSAKCETCGYPFRLVNGITPKHRPLTKARKSGD